MYKNYLKIAFRNLFRAKGFSLINISGLAVGMASATLILLWIYNEVSYDRFHTQGDYIYKAMNRGVFDGKLQVWDNTPRILAPTLKREYPEIADVSRKESRWFVTKAGERRASTQAIITDPAFLLMFDFPMLHGDRKTALSNVNSIVVTEKMALKMFGTTDAVNKIITIDKDNLKVTAVLQDLPPNTSFAFDYILPFEYLIKIDGHDDSWGNNNVNTYVKLKPNISLEAFDRKVASVTQRHSKGEEEHEVFLHPISKWHLYSNFENGKVSGGRIAIVRLFGIIAGFILLIACINFMNLSTARSQKRAREVGVRKTAGASKGLLIGQFIGESVLISMIAGIFAWVLVLLFLPYFNQLVGKQLAIPYANPGFWFFALAFVAFTGLLAGSYPAFFLSSFQPISILKGTFRGTRTSVNSRKVLVVIQFSFAIILIISTMMVTQQIRYAQNRDVGYDRGKVVYHWITGDLNKNYTLIKNELLTTGVAASVTKTMAPLGTVVSDTWGVEWQGKNQSEKIDFERFTEDEKLVKTGGLRLISGRDMDLAQYPSDSSAMLLNESAVKVMGFKNPIGQLVIDGDMRYHVIGVVKDFVVGSPYRQTRPMIIEGAQSYFNVIHVKFSDTYSITESLKAVEGVFKKYNPEYPFEYHFVDQDFSVRFEDTETVARLSGLFAGLTIFISCLGLFGLAAYMAENRVKEIGVRKVLGASVAGIATLLSKEFLVLVVVAIVIAVPIAWYGIDIWLQDYDYRVGMQWWVFVLAGILAILVSLGTVSYQAIRAALLDPVRALRSE
jgi:putative ABC transport system permease protein